MGRSTFLHLSPAGEVALMACACVPHPTFHLMGLLLRLAGSAGAGAHLTPPSWPRHAGLVAPLCRPEVVFDFRLKHVVSINVSGHK